MNSRERTLLILLVLTFGGWQGWKLLDASLFEPVRRRNQEITALQDSINDKQLQQRRIDNLNDQLNEWKTQSLPPDPVVASAVYQMWIIDLAAKSQLTEVVVNPNLSLNPRPVADTYVPIVLRMSAKGTFDQLADFIDRIRNTKLMQRIVNLNLSDPTKDNPAKLTFALQLEGLSFVGIDDRKTLFLDPLPPEVSPKSPDFNDQLTVLKKQIIFGEPVPVVVDDPAQHMVLSATFPTAENPAAWFLEKRQNKKEVIFKGKDFQLAGVTGKVVDVGNDFVELEVGEKKSKLRIGKPLKEIASGIPTPGTPNSPPGPPPGFDGMRGGRGGRRGRGNFDFNSLTPEQQQQMRERMERFREMRRNGGGGDFPGFGDFNFGGDSGSSTPAAAPADSK